MLTCLKVTSQVCRGFHSGSESLKNSLAQLWCCANIAFRTELDYGTVQMFKYCTQDYVSERNNWSRAPVLCKRRTLADHRDHGAVQMLHSELNLIMVP